MAGTELEDDLEEGSGGGLGGGAAVLLEEADGEDVAGLERGGLEDGVRGLSGIGLGVQELEDAGVAEGEAVVELAELDGLRERRG